MEVDCTLLRSVVQDAWNGQYTIDHLNKTLVRFQDALANPLQQAAPDADSRAKIQSRSVRLAGEVQEITLQSDVVAWILEFSDAVELNELDVLRLLLQAFRMDPDDRRRCDSEKDTAVSLYFSQREDLLVALLDIVQMVGDDADSSPSLARAMQSFFDRLKDANLVRNCIDRIRFLSRMKLSVYMTYVDNEIRLLALILFYIEMHSGLDNRTSSQGQHSNVVALCTVAEEMSLSIPSVRTHYQQQNNVLVHCHSLTTSIYIILTTIINAVSQTAGGIDLPKWAPPGTPSPLFASYDLMRKIIGAVVPSALGDTDLATVAFDGLSGFGAFVNQMPTLSPKSQIDICDCLAKFVVYFLGRHFSTVRSTKNPGALLSLIGSLIAAIANVSEDHVAVFWRCKAVSDLLHALDLDTPPDSPRFSSFCDLIVALSRGDDGPRAVQFLAGAKGTNWHRIFDLFHRAIRDMSLAPSKGPTSAPVAQIECLVAVCPTTSTRILSAIAAYVVGHPSEVGQVWDRLEGVQILDTQPVPGTSPRRGLQHDLEDVEVPDGSYPLTTAFLSLLLALMPLTPTSMRVKLGAPLRAPGIAPYVTYVRTSILAPLCGRTYNLPSEKWTIASLCLQFLSYVIDDSDVVESLMSSQSRELRAIVEVIESCAASQDANTGDALQAALDLLRGALERQDDVVKQMTRASREHVTLSSALLRQPNTIGIICGLVGAPPGSFKDLSVQVNAADVLQAVALRDPTLVARLLSSLRLSDSVRASWSTQLLCASSDAVLHERLKSTIIRTMTDTLGGHWPNIAHVLVGFDTTSAACDGARLAHASNGCLTALIDLICRPGWLAAWPHLGQISLRLICNLLEDPVTRALVHQFISLHYDSFFTTCLRSLPTLADAASCPRERRSDFMLQEAWLLKSIALDLQLRRQLDQTMMFESTSSALDLLGLSTAYLHQLTHHATATPSSPLMLTLLDSIYPAVDGGLPEYGGLERSTCSVIGRETLSNCIEQRGEQFVWRLDRLQQASLASGLDAAAIVESAKRFNRNVFVLEASRTAAHCWCQLIQVWILERNDAGDRHMLPILLELLSSLLSKLSDANWAPASASFATTALALAVQIRLIARGGGVTADHRVMEGVLSGIMGSQSLPAKNHLFALFYVYMDLLGASASRTRGREWALSQSLADLNISSTHLIQRIAYPVDLLVPLLERSSQMVRFVQVLTAGSQSLPTALTSSPANYHLVLSLESHLLFLVHVAQSPSGAKALFSADVLGRIGEANYLSARPPPTVHTDCMNPSAMQKYHQLLLPTLQLVISLLTTMPNRHDVHARVLDFLLVTHLNAFTAVVSAQPPATSADHLSAFQYAVAIVLALASGPSHARPELAAMVQLVLQQFPVLSTLFRDSMNSQPPSPSYADLYRDLVSLCAFLVQRRLYVFDASIDPKLDTTAAVSTSKAMPLGLLIYFAIPSSLGVLRDARLRKARAEEILGRLERSEVDGEAVEDGAAPSTATYRDEIASAIGSERTATMIAQQALQIVFLSLQMYGTDGDAADSVRPHTSRLRQAVEQCEAALGADDELVDKQVRRIRSELDALDGKAAAAAAVAVPDAGSTPVPQLMYF
ncbi:unnamed protein product (mitochondrion) [Plasmodiophora brassicae]|uniref:Uncharacterized protein n=1 Tax=Plasmodiophora brassicae TaxID=37360 RepID=A0A3P3YN32_PLABS|nr:unnamed protein product [Plasmodiophora brassicae]